MSDCKTCGHPERWHSQTSALPGFPGATHCNEWGCKCVKYEASK